MPAFCKKGTPASVPFSEPYLEVVVFLVVVRAVVTVVFLVLILFFIVVIAIVAVVELIFLILFFVVLVIIVFRHISFLLINFCYRSSMSISFPVYTYEHMKLFQSFFINFAQKYYGTLVLFWYCIFHNSCYNDIVSRNNPSSFLLTDPYINYLYSPH